jgi:hypothetical protein
MAQEYRPGRYRPQSGIYAITHDPMHADMPAKHVSEVEHFKEPDVAPM